jgi:hypothetical protein
LFGKYSIYVKSRKTYYYYPPELQFVSGYPANTYTHYPASGLVVFDTLTHPYVILSTTGVTPGNYIIPASSYSELEMYDGTIVSVTSSLNKWTVTVQEPSTIANKVSLGVQNRNYNPDL